MDSRSLQLASERYEAAKAKRDEAIRQASAAGMTYRAIAAVVGVSFQRVAQIVQSDSP